MNLAVAPVRAEGYAAGLNVPSLCPRRILFHHRLACPDRGRFSRDCGVAPTYIRRMATSIQAIRDDFEFLDEWEDRYRYVIDLGRDLAPLPDAARDDAHKVPGCVSQVWLLTTRGPGDDPVMHFIGDSDAHIVRGLVAIMIALYSGQSASAVLDIDAEATLRDLGLDEHLTPQRANGLRSMIRRIRAEASQALAPASAQ